MAEKISLRNIPAVETVLTSPELARTLADFPRPAVVAAVRLVLDDLRGRVLAGTPDGPAATEPAELARRVAEEAARLLRPAAVRVINATGIIVHTNLGRAPLAPEAVAAAVAVAGYCNLEYDLETGQRGGRTSEIESLLTALTGAEAAAIVNNNAAALLLILAALAKDRQVIVSRGELIEIGGSFRLPEIMAAGGCVMREVGTTNKTKLADYAKAVNDKTAMLMKVHTSNYEVVGFTAAVSLGELAALGREVGLPVVEDLGSGNLVALPRLPEPTVQESVKAGADLITFSGDKLLGGPQCGLIVGRTELVARLKAHPLYRAVRVDKMSLAALEATLRIYLYDDPVQKIPVTAALNQDIGVVNRRAETLAGLLGPVEGIEAAVVKTKARVGGGAVPGQEIESFGLRLRCAPAGPDEVAARLRRAERPIVGRIEDGAVILDMMAVADDELRVLADGIRRTCTLIT